jgi:hypothetical protein
MFSTMAALPTKVLMLEFSNCLGCRWLKLNTKIAILHTAKADSMCWLT